MKHLHNFTPMKNILLLVTAALVLSCNTSVKESQSLTELKTKKAALITKIDRFSKELKAIESAISELDTLQKLMTVTSIKAEVKGFNHYIEVQGTVKADQTIELHAEMGGTVTAILVKEGQNVLKGQLLATLDSGVIDSSVLQLETQLALATTTYERQSRLWEQNIGSEIQYLQSKAQKESLENNMKSLKAQARKMKITAPLIIINAFLILIGVLFEVKVFQTYKFDGRFAYNGLILSQGFTPFLYLCATTIFWVYKDKKMLLLLLTLCCLSGLKGVYFGEFLLLGLLVLSNKEFKKRFKIIILLRLLIIFTTLLVTLLLTPMFVNVLESKGLTSAIFSYRTDNALEIFNQINENNFNILIGALETEVVRLEMQIFDVILFFGALGLVAYFLFLQLLYKKIVKDSVPKVFFATILALSALSGNLLYIPLSSLLMYLVLMSLHSPQKNE